MNKKKWIKVIFVLLFIVLAGILYSCRVNNKEKVSLITDQGITEAEVNVNQTKDENLVQSNENALAVDETKDNSVKNGTSDLNNKNSPDADMQTVENASSSEAPSGYIYVHICGEVLKPDVYKVLEDARVYEVIAKAGGLTDAAADAHINQAAAVSDGQQIYIPSIEEAADILPGEFNVSGKETTERTDSKTAGTVNINSASADELMTLSGIGQAKAQAIIDYRGSNGGFKTIAEIKNIDGIKDAVYNKIKDKISVE